MRRINNNGVSMILEYLILASILSVFILVFSLNINSVLEDAQLSRVVENQFSDVSAQISSQVVDILAIYPKNGNMTAMVFMPQKIGDVEYSVKLEEGEIKIVSEDGRFYKYLSLGAATNLVNLSGLTHSLKESHELLYTKTSCIFPTAVVRVNPSSVYVGESFTIDVSDTSPGSVKAFEWRYYNPMNKSWSEWYDSSNKTVTVNVNEWLNSWDCEYNNTIAVCPISVEVRIYCERYLNDTASTAVVIGKSIKESGGFANITIEKFVKPPQVLVGENAELHIRLDGMGISGGKRMNLTAVLTLDSSGSMGDESYIPLYLLEMSTLYDTVKGYAKRNPTFKYTLQLPTNLANYQWVLVEVVKGESDVDISKITYNGSEHKTCSSDECYVRNVGNEKVTVEFKGKDDKGPYYFEANIYISKMDSLKLSAIDYVNSLGSEDFVGLVEYDTEAVVHEVGNSTLLYLTTNKNNLTQAIINMKPEGATNIYHALWKANKTLFENTSITGGRIPLIILMTDGKPTVEAYNSSCTSFITDGIPFCNHGYWCPSNCYSQIEDLAEQIKNTKINGEKIRICTIGFGREGEFNETLLYNIASEINETAKCSFTAQTDEQLKNAFRSITALFEIAATNVIVTDVIPENIKLETAYLVSVRGSPVCEESLTKDIQNRTVISLNCSVIRINDVVDLVVQVKVDQPGTYALDVPDISNVTYKDTENKLVSVPLELVSIRVGEAGVAEVEIR